MERATGDRNDLFHALPVAQGLLRRMHGDTVYRTLYDIESVKEIRHSIERARAEGNAVLYSDGGARVKGWSKGGGS
jgi:hypothetical protein